MANSLIGGLINAGYSASDITIAEPDEARRQVLNEQFKISVTKNNADTLQCDIIVLAVKPQLLKTVCLQLAPDRQNQANNPLFISIAAGVKSTDINRWLNANQDSLSAIVRCMPNTPSLLQCGASGLFANKQVSNAQKTSAEAIMQAVGIVIWVETEEQLNAVTAVSGSGPAYFFLMMEAMQQAGEALGLSKEISQKLVLQTALGASRMAMESEHSPAELRQRVTSQGGTTEQAILSFQNADFVPIVRAALQAANDRSISLANELGASPRKESIGSD